MTPGAPGPAGGFPPLTPADIDAYPLDDVVEGYRGYERGDPEPGPNRSPGFRWGWTNRRRDGQRNDDGHDAVRRDHIAEGRLKAAASAGTTEGGVPFSHLGRR